MKQTNNALLLGVVKSEDEMGRLLKTAQVLGEAVGKLRIAEQIQRVVLCIGLSIFRTR